jgi:hypothetical protein
MNYFVGAGAIVVFYFCYRYFYMRRTPLNKLGIIIDDLARKSQNENLMKVLTEYRNNIRKYFCHLKHFKKDIDNLKWSTNDDDYKFTILGGLLSSHGKEMQNLYKTIDGDYKELKKIWEELKQPEEDLKSMKENDEGRTLAQIFELGLKNWVENVDSQVVMLSDLKRENLHLQDDKEHFNMKKLGEILRELESLWTLQHGSTIVITIDNKQL